MKVSVFSTKSYDRMSLDAANTLHKHELIYHEARLSSETASLAAGCDAVCVFVNDELDRSALALLKQVGVRSVALRCAGFNNVDLEAARDKGLVVTRVPAYSPYAVAEHTIALILCLNRKVHRAYNRVREGNFALDGLVGFDMNGRTVGVIGTGQIGLIVGRILRSFGCRVLAYDVHPNPECQALQIHYVPLGELFAQADIVTLHCPLVPATHYLINDAAIASMKKGVMIINTGRGALINTTAAIKGLKSGKIGYLGLDVYEEESKLFFEDHSERVLHDDVFARLLTFPNVVITGHQAFFTNEALQAIASTTLASLSEFEKMGACSHAVTAPHKGAPKRS
jgi:D-lactate dehydrogenase